MRIEHESLSRVKRYIAMREASGITDTGGTICALIRVVRAQTHANIAVLPLSEAYSIIDN